MVNPVPRFCLILLMLPAALSVAGDRRDDWPVTSLGLNHSTYGASWRQAGSPLTRDFNLNSGYVALYALPVWPGQHYSLTMRVRAGARRARVYLYDRWPFLPDAKRTPLPMGPVVAVAGQHHITYCWHLGISPRSTALMAYVLVQYPRRPDGRRDRGPRLALFSPPIDPTAEAGRGISFLDGPRSLLLQSGSAQLSYPVATPPAATEPENTPLWPGVDDLVVNGSFLQGLQGWRPGDKSLIALEDGAGLALLPRAGDPVVIRQMLNGSSATDQAPILTTDLRLGQPSDQSPTRLLISLCNVNSSDPATCGDQEVIASFSTGSKQSTTADPLTAKKTMSIPAGQWIHYRYAVQELGSQSGLRRVLALQAEGKGPVWIRDIHLIKGGADESPGTPP